MKQQIEIDVPDGFEVDSVVSLCSLYEDEAEDIRVFFKKKQPEFIEVRTYLYKNSTGLVPASICKDERYNNPGKIEGMQDFVKWLDPDWRQVEV